MSKDADFDSLAFKRPELVHTVSRRRIDFRLSDDGELEEGKLLRPPADYRWIEPFVKYLELLETKLVNLP